MKAVKSKNQANAFINKNFIIRVNDLTTGKKTLASANTLDKYLYGAPLINLYTGLLQAKWQERTFKYRNRLIIEIVSK